MKERDDLYKKFVKAIHDVQQKSNLKNLLLEKKLGALGDTLEKKEAQLNEVLTASNLDPSALSVVTRKLEVNLIRFSMWFIILYLMCLMLLEGCAWFKEWSYQRFAVWVGSGLQGTQRSVANLWGQAGAVRHTCWGDGLQASWELDRRCSAAVGQRRFGTCVGAYLKLIFF